MVRLYSEKRSRLIADFGVRKRNNLEYFWAKVCSQIYIRIYYVLRHYYTKQAIQSRQIQNPLKCEPRDTHLACGYERCPPWCWLISERKWGWFWSVGGLVFAPALEMPTLWEWRMWEYGLVLLARYRFAHQTRNLWDLSIHKVSLSPSRHIWFHVFKQRNWFLIILTALDSLILAKFP